jgi:hypothetical protein
MQRFLAPGAIFLAATLSILPAAHAEDILTAYAHEHGATAIQ